MEKRCLVSRGFLAVVLLYVFNNFIMCYFDSLFQNEIRLSPISVFAITA